MQMHNRMISLDRFIPLRNHSQNCHSMTKSVDKSSTKASEYSKLFGSLNGSKVLKFSKSSQQTSLVLSKFIVDSIQKKNQHIYQPIKTQAYKIIDAPNVVDNFYYNLLDWSSKQCLGLGLSTEVFLQRKDLRTESLFRLSGSQVTSVKFIQSGQILLLGEWTGRVQVHDVQKLRPIREIKSNYDRIGCLECVNTHSFFTGSKDRVIKFHDLRQKDSWVQTFQGHKGEICGLSQKNWFLASGGNDNKVLLWDVRANRLLKQLKFHKGAVKAIEWCPWKNQCLATAGGSKDRRIVFWNGQKEEVQSFVNVKSQTTSLHWKKTTHELITTHSGKNNGYGVIWDLSTSSFRSQLVGHQGRILSMVINVNQEDQLCTLGADETVRFWNTRNQSFSEEGQSLPLNGSKIDNIQELR